VQRKLETALAYRLKDKPVSDKLAIAAEALAGNGAAFHGEMTDLLHAELGRAFGSGEQTKLLAWAASLNDDANRAYLSARFAADAGDAALAASHWQRLFQLHAGRDPFHLLAYARALTDQGCYPQAVLQLQLALAQPLKYAFFPRAEKLVKKLSRLVESHLRQTRIAVLGTSTTALLVPVLEAFCLRDRIKVEFYEGLYGSQQQEILDPQSGLAKFGPNLVFLVNNWRDLQLPALAADEREQVERVLATRKQLWQLLSDRFGCHIVQLAFDFPAEEPHGYLANSLRGGRTRAIQLLNQAMQEAAPSYVSILDTPALEREAGAARWQDANLWYNFQQHPSTEALPILADAMLAHVRAVLGLTRKVLVTDLDNTLWKGVIGEDGLEGIKIGPGSPAGEAHSRLQQYLLDLKARGILLAVASKNNYEDAASPFLKHPHMLLRMEDFAAFEANWNDKATSIRDIARKLSLGLDSFVFLDDNPIEREWVRAQIPEVAVVELGPSVFHYVQELDRGRYFFALSLSAEDQVRAEQYRSEAARKHLQATSQSLDDFLAHLQLRASCVPVGPKNLVRVTQLTNKTNQFNLTTRRYTEAQVTQLAANPDAWAAAFHLADRMGDYGLIGVIFCRPGSSRTQWEVDTWLMSCRVLGRQMEKFMMDRLEEAARARGIYEIVGVFRPTAKNGLVKDHYDQLGFERIGATPEEVRYRRVVPTEESVRAMHIRNETAPVLTPA
jgi:FkbH-like protein